MPPLSAARLIELLAGYIAEHGADINVVLAPSSNRSPQPVVRCWFDAFANTVHIGSH